RVGSARFPDAWRGTGPEAPGKNHQGALQAAGGLPRPGRDGRDLRLFKTLEAHAVSTTTPESKAGTISLADEEAVKQDLAQSVFSLWDIVNNLPRLRPSKRERYRVTIFGSARAGPGTFVYNEVKRVAASPADLGCDIITGGGPGLMQAANEGAAAVNAPER